MQSVRRQNLAGALGVRDEFGGSHAFFGDD